MARSQEWKEKQKAEGKPHELAWKLNARSLWNGLPGLHRAVLLHPASFLPGWDISLELQKDDIANPALQAADEE